MKAIEAGLLTDGSSYSPTPSQRLNRSWLILLAFVPAHSGASVRDLHPLPACSTSIVIPDRSSAKYLTSIHRCQNNFARRTQRPNARRGIPRAVPADGVSPAGPRAKSCLLADLTQATLTGMIGAFGRESEAGLGQPHAITGGIGEALIATAMGHLVAIAPLITHKDFRARLEESVRGGR